MTPPQSGTSRPRCRVRARGAFRTPSARRTRFPPICCSQRGHRKTGSASGRLTVTGTASCSTKTMRLTPSARFHSPRAPCRARCAARSGRTSRRPGKACSWWRTSIAVLRARWRRVRPNGCASARNCPLRSTRCRTVPTAPTTLRTCAGTPRPRTCSGARSAGRRSSPRAWWVRCRWRRTVPRTSSRHRGRCSTSSCWTATTTRSSGCGRWCSSSRARCVRAPAATRADSSRPTSPT